MSKPRYAAAAAAMAPALTNADPKCGIDTSRIAATNATPSQESVATWAAQVENRLDRMVRIIDRGTADGRPGGPGRACRRGRGSSPDRSRRRSARGHDTAA